jgi:methyl-accepting chemotaxis protein
VAGEVKSLAQESRKATIEVRRVLGGIQRATGGAVDVSEQGSQHVVVVARPSLTRPRHRLASEGAAGSGGWKEATEGRGA